MAVLVAAASLLPPLFARDDAVGEFATLLGQYATRDVGAEPLTRVPLLLKGLIGGGWSGVVLFTPLERGHELALVAQCIALLLALAGLATGPRESPVARVGIAAGIATLAQAVFLVLVRPTTPLWMMSTLLAPAAVMLACGWWLLARRSIAWASLVGLAAMFHVLLGLAISWHSVRELDSVRAAEGPPPLLDATAPFPTRFVDQPIARMRLRRLERAARLGCGATLHGDFAAGDETAIGLPTRRACGERRPVRYGGREGPARHVAGFVATSWCAIGLRPEGFAGGFGITTRLVPLFPQQGPGWPQLAPTEVNLPPPSLQVTPVRVDALLARGSVLAITTRYRNFGESRLDRVLANGRSARLLHADNSSSFYACRDCDGPTQRWIVEGTGFDRAVDIVALQPMTRGPDACAVR